MGPLSVTRPPPSRSARPAPRSTGSRVPTVTTCGRTASPFRRPNRPSPRDLASDDRKHIVVVVDDDTLTLSLVARTLTDYRVSTARDGGEALVILSTTDPVHLLITDYLMPVMTGEELVKRARLQRPELSVLIMTGHSTAVAAADPDWWAANAIWPSPSTSTRCAPPSAP